MTDAQRDENILLINKKLDECLEKLEKRDDLFITIARELGILSYYVKKQGN